MENTEENYEMIWKILKKGKSNGDKIWTIWKKGKLNCEKIWKILKKIVKRYGDYGWKASRIVKILGKYIRKLWKDMRNMDEK